MEEARRSSEDASATPGALHSCVALQVVAGDPGPNGWFPSPYPLTMLGPPDLGGGNYSVSATARFSPAPSGHSRLRPPPALPQPWTSQRPQASSSGGSSGASPGAVGSGAYAMPCVNLSEEVFTWNASSAGGPGYVSSSWGGSTGCLTTCGCEAGCIQFWLCGQGGCGEPGQSYEWSMPQGSPGPLANAAYAPGGVLTYAGGGLSIANDSGADGQVRALWGALPLRRAPLNRCTHRCGHSTLPRAGGPSRAWGSASRRLQWPVTAPLPR